MVLCGAYFVRGCGCVLSLCLCAVSIFFCINHPVKNEGWIFAVHTMTFIRDWGGLCKCFMVHHNKSYSVQREAES